MINTKNAFTDSHLIDAFVGMKNPMSYRHIVNGQFCSQAYVSSKLSPFVSRMA